MTDQQAGQIVELLKDISNKIAWGGSAGTSLGFVHTLDKIAENMASIGRQVESIERMLDRRFHG